MRDQVRVEKKVVKGVRCQSLNPTNQNKKATFLSPNKSYRLALFFFVPL